MPKFAFDLVLDLVLNRRCIQEELILGGEVSEHNKSVSELADLKGKDLGLKMISRGT